MYNGSWVNFVVGHVCHGSQAVTRCLLSSRRSDQSRRTHDGRTYRAEFLARRVGGGWPNASLTAAQKRIYSLAVMVKQCLRPALWLDPFGDLGDRRTQHGQVVRGVTVKTLMHRHTELERDQICHIEPVQLSMTELSQTTFVFPCAAHHSRCSIHDSLQLVGDGFVASSPVVAPGVTPTGGHRSPTGGLR